jgi:hypothetical protein
MAIFSFVERKCDVESLRELRMQITTAKLISLAIAVVYVVSLGVTRSLETTVQCSVFLLLPLALIWFPEQLGRATGFFVKGSYVDAESPPILLSILGWFFLLGLPALLVFLSWSAE